MPGAALRASILALLFALGCSAAADLHAAPSMTDWRRVATAPDRERLRGWRKAWIDALASVGPIAPVARETALFDPDRALPDALPPPGDYSCRVYKLGAHGSAARDFNVHPVVACHVALEKGVTSLYRVAGPQRPIGTLYPDGATRAIFLGTMVLGDESRPLRYGQDARRDMAGYIERIAPRRWRLVLPYPQFESMLDVVDITPAAVTP